MTEKARPGSMLEAEEKSLGTAKIVTSIVTLILLCLTHFGLFHTYLSFWFKRASQGAAIAGAVLFGLCFLSIWASKWISEKSSNETLWYIIWIALLLAAIATSCGFNFSL